MYSCPTGTHPYKIQYGDSLFLIAQRYQTTIQEITAVNPETDINNLYIGKTIFIPQDYNSCQMPDEDTSEAIGIAELALSNQMRMLWEQHVYWTRMFILSTAFSLPDAEFVTDRLLRNPQDFGEVLRLFYGDDIASVFENLFTSHLTIAGELVNAAKAVDSAAADDAERRWYENADEIAGFLGSINPYWSAQEWQQMLYDHLAMTKSEAVDILSNNFSDSIDMFENIEQEALEMADIMTQGIVMQFPQYFE